MTIKLLLRVIFGVAISIAIVLLLIILMLKQGLIESEQASQDRYALSHLAQLSSQNSTNLTSLARQYVVTLNPKYKTEYYDLVAKINGEKAWLDGRKLSYLNRLAEYQVDAADLNLLKKSNQLSMTLVNTEEKAFNLISDLVGKDNSNLSDAQEDKWIRAIDLVTDQNYLNETHKIFAPV